jgi:hypothetical protein
MKYFLDKYFTEVKVAGSNPVMTAEWKINGALAQLARAPALHAGGHRFDSDRLHKWEVVDNQTIMSSQHYWLLQKL